MPHPLALPGGLFPLQPSIHAAREAIAEQQGRGYLKRCAHLSLIRVDPSGSLYQVICRQDSFEPTKELAPHFLGRCPKDCLLYQTPWRARFSQWRRNRHPAIWFERQAWPGEGAWIPPAFLVA